ncbi:MAG: sel1 repeat family protein, partial [Gammaproteobacteria bacterium]|nr:sel1 repeat family protein [Gammaproteobacteria bacterium]
LVQMARSDPNYLRAPELLDAGVLSAAAVPPSLQVPPEVAKSKRQQRRRAWWRRASRRAAWSFAVLMMLAAGTVYYYGPISGTQLQTEVSKLLQQAQDVASVGELPVADSTGDGVGLTTATTSDGDFPVATVSGETSRELDALLRQAQRHIDKGRLIGPPGANGYEVYQAVLRRTPDNELAHAGLRKIADQFLIFAQEQATARQFDEAEASLRRGLKVSPDHDGLLAFQSSLERVVHADVAYREAEKYFFGDGVAVDYAEAARHYLAAAELGHAAAQTGIGVSYGNGYGLDASEQQAIRWLQRAARQGDPMAQYNLGLGLVFGTTAAPNEALQWAIRAAQQDYEPAYRLLSWMYQSGSGVAQSTKESLKWGIKSAFAPLPANAKFVDAWESRLAELTAVSFDRDADSK